MHWSCIVMHWSCIGHFILWQMWEISKASTCEMASKNNTGRWTRACQRDGRWSCPWWGTSCASPSLNPPTRGVCPQLSNILGGEECFGDEATGDRWRVLLQSDCSEGKELRQLWRNLQEEERQAASWLEIEMQENLGQRVGEVGGDSRDGSTRGRIAEERDVTWAKLVRKGLEMHPKQDRTNRPVWSWLQRDKLSAAWLQALPGFRSLHPKKVQFSRYYSKKNPENLSRVSVKIAIFAKTLWSDLHRILQMLLINNFRCLIRV